MTQDIASDSNKIGDRQSDSKPGVDVSSDGRAARLCYAVKTKKSTGGLPPNEKVRDKKRNRLQSLDQEAHRVTTLNRRN